MGCGSGRCSSNSSTPSGCGSTGSCSSGGCNRLNTFDWLSDINEPATSRFDMVEISFKNGARKEFFRNPFPNECLTGDEVVVNSRMGYDIGKISLSGELVRLQMKKKGAKLDAEYQNIDRRATEKDIKMAKLAWAMEHNTMLMARVISRDLNLEMKIGDVEYQADGRKATFYYIAPGRVDFRELIRLFAREFQVKIEMRQIGNRFEASRIGGIGSCGRELCCSTWLTKYKPVTTTAARYQNLSINQTKLSGQCGRLKCCLNFELDSYMDALKAFPKNPFFLKTKEHTYKNFKTDIFKQELWYAAPDTKPVCVPLERVKEVLEMNKNREYPETLVIKSDINFDDTPATGFGDHEFEQIDLPNLPKEKRRKNRNRNKNKNRNNKNNNRQENKNVPGDSKQKNTPQTNNKPNNKPNNKRNKPKAKTPDVKAPKINNKLPKSPKEKKAGENPNRDRNKNPNQNKNRNKNKDGNNNGNNANSDNSKNDKKE